MSSPCLCRAVPVSQSRLREVKLSLKTSREAGTIRSNVVGREISSRAYSTGKEVPVRVSTNPSRSRSTPPVYRAQRPDSKKGPKTNGHKPEHLPERNGTLLDIPPTTAPLTLSTFSSSTSSSSYTPKLTRPSSLRPPPSSSSSSSSQGMRRARWLSYSTSNICFNSILDGRFRQLQGRVFSQLSPAVFPLWNRMHAPPPCLLGIKREGGRFTRFESAGY